MSSSAEPKSEAGDALESAIDQAIAACGGDLRAAIGALIVANNLQESKIAELRKGVSSAYMRGRFQTYSG